MMTNWDEVDDEIAALMSESPVADNHGSRVVASGSRTLSTDLHETRISTQRYVSDPKEYYYQGMVAHRGVLHPSEHVDLEALQFHTEQYLGFTMERIAFLYSKPNPSAKDKPDKEALEDIFLSLEDEGGNMGLLGWVVGFPVKGDGTCTTMSRALARARTRRGL